MHKQKMETTLFFWRRKMDSGGKQYLVFGGKWFRSTMDMFRWTRLLEVMRFANICTRLVFRWNFF